MRHMMKQTDGGTETNGFLAPVDLTAPKVAAGKNRWVLALALFFRRPDQICSSPRPTPTSSDAEYSCAEQPPPDSDHLYTIERIPC